MRYSVVVACAAAFAALACGRKPEEPGTTGEFQNDPGWGAIVGTGANSRGAKFLNFYHFSPCRDRLVLVDIDENAQ